MIIESRIECIVLRYNVYDLNSHLRLSQMTASESQVTNELAGEICP